MAEAASAADALQKYLDAEVADRSALEAMVASVCEGLGVSVGVAGTSLRSRIEALYSRAVGRMREALHTGVKKALAVVSSHYVASICRRLVRAMSSLMTKRRPRRSYRGLKTPRTPREMPWLPSSTLRWSFLPSARRDLGKQGNKAL